jgi:hypothetical protein
MNPVRRAAGIGSALASICIAGACASGTPGAAGFDAVDAARVDAAPVESLDPDGPWHMQVRLADRLTTVEVHPARGPAAAAGVAILAHGFLRSRVTMRGHAQALSRAGIIAMAPDLPFLVDSRDNARALRQLVAMVQAGRIGGRVVPAALPVVLVGFSAGALAALLASDAPGVAGYIGLDPFDRPGRIGREFARSLQTPVLLVRGGPSACNGYSIGGPWAEVAPRLDGDLLLPLATHCDFESPTDWLCRLVCGAATQTTAQSIQDALTAGVLRFVAPPPDPENGLP